VVFSIRLNAIKMSAPNWELQRLIPGFHIWQMKTAKMFLPFPAKRL